MSIESVIVAATSQDLTTVKTFVAETAISCSTAELRVLERKITAVSAQIRAFCHRQFAEERVIMNVKGYGSTQLLLERFPIVEVHSVAFDGEPVTDFTIDDRFAGTLYRRNGWQWTTGSFAGGFAGGAPIAPHPHPSSEEALYTIDVTAGYVLDSFGSFTPNVNSVNLPEDIEAAALITIKDAFATRAGVTVGGLGEVASVKTTGVAINYAVRSASSIATQVRAATGLPTDAVALLQPYVIIK